MECERNFFLGTEEDNKGNGYRYITPSIDGSLIELRIPRDRMGHFKPHILELIKHNQERLAEVSFALYTSGLSTSQVGDVFEKIYGKAYSKSGISHLCEESKKHALHWLERPLESFYPIIYIDAHFNSVCREKKVTKEAFYVVLGVKEDFTREVLAVVNHPTESSSLWQDVFENLKDRGLEKVKLCVSDALPHIQDAVQTSFYGVAVQFCTVHLKRRLISFVKPERKAELSEDLKELFKTDEKGYTKKDAEIEIKRLIKKWEAYPNITKRLEAQSMTYYITYLDYHPSIQSMLYTTNWIERLNKSFKIAMNVRQSMPNSNSALALLSAVALKMTNTTYKYPIYKFRIEEKLKK